MAKLRGVRVRALSIPDAFEVTPGQHADERGVFLEWFRPDILAEAVGRPFAVRQGNISVSARGVVRGVHYADVPPGQAKYVTVISGAVLDYIVDLRVGSPAFGTWEAVRLDDVDRRAVFLAEGLGHAFVALTDDVTVSYLVSETYAPGREHGVSPLDPDLALDFPFPPEELRLSPKDLDAPTLAAARDAGALPQWEEVRAFYGTLV